MANLEFNAFVNKHFIKKNSPVYALERAARDSLRKHEKALEKQFGTLLLGIEDEFTVHGIDYRREHELIAYLTDTLQNKFGSLFSSIDQEHPLMRVRDSIDAGKNIALHVPDTFRLELVTNHENDGDYFDSSAVYKAKKLAEMRKTIEECVDKFSNHTGVTSWNPRPIPDLYKHLTKSITAVDGKEIFEDEILERIKEQVTPDLIGGERILNCSSLAELLVGSNSPILNEGAAGSGVHLNIGFRGKNGENPFYNPEYPDIGTPVTWNAAAGIIDITHMSTLPFTNLERSSWLRIGNKELSAPVDACYHPLKKGGAIVKQNPYSKEFYEAHNVPYKVTISNENAHIEIRHADGGHGIRDGSALIMTQLCATLAGISMGLEENKIHSYDELREHRKTLCDSFDTALERFKFSNKLRQVYGEPLHQAILDFVSSNDHKLEEIWSDDIEIYPHLETM